MDGVNGGRIEQVLLDADHGKVVFEILLYILSADTFMVAPVARILEGKV